MSILQIVPLRKWIRNMLLMYTAPRFSRYVYIDVGITSLLYLTILLFTFYDPYQSSKGLLGN